MAPLDPRFIAYLWPPLALGASSSSSVACLSTSTVGWISEAYPIFFQIEEPGSISRQNTISYRKSPTIRDEMRFVVWGGRGSSNIITRIAGKLR